MEFFREIEHPGLDVDRLKRLLTIDSLPRLCASISSVLSRQGDAAEIYCLWGQFSLRRDVLRHGVRFSLLSCPHALAWTVAFHQPDGRVIIHCTIDETAQELEFIESIHQFLDDWVQGLGNALTTGIAL